MFTCPILKDDVAFEVASHETSVWCINAGTPSIYIIKVMLLKTGSLKKKYYVTSTLTKEMLLASTNIPKYEIFFMQHVTICPTLSLACKIIKRRSQTQHKVM